MDPTRSDACLKKPHEKAQCSKACEILGHGAKHHQNAPDQEICSCELAYRKSLHEVIRWDFARKVAEVKDAVRPRIVGSNKVKIFPHAIDGSV